MTTKTSSEFRRLKKKWDQILQESGFRDIERYYADGRPYPTIYKHDFGAGNRKIDPVKYEEVSEYYRLARQFLHDYSFESPKEKKIWELHSDGLSYRKIIRNLGLNCCPATLGKRINRLKRIMLEGLYERQT